MGLSEGNKVLLSAPLKHPVVMHALPAAPDIHTGALMLDIIFMIAAKTVAIAVFESFIA